MVCPKSEGRQSALHYALFAIVLFATLPAAAQARARLTAEAVARQAARLDSIAEAFRKAEQVPGLALAIAGPDGRLLYAKGYGWADVASQRATTNRTVFRIFSISKTYAAAVAHLMVQDSTLALDVPVGRYLPELPSWRDSVTVRDLLRHTSGIEDYSDMPGYEAASNAGRSDDPDFVDRAIQRPLRFAPGTQWSYNNTNYALVGRIIERVTGDSVATVLDKRILAPAGLRETSSACPISGIATGYTPAWRLRIPGDSLVASAQRNAHRWDLAVGGLCATAADVARFFALLVSGRVVNPTSLASMTRLPSGIAAKSGAGLWVRTDDEGMIYSHSGGGGNGTSEVFVFPRDSIVVAAITNRGGPDVARLLRAVRREVLGLPHPAVSFETTLTLAEATSLLGTYVDSISNRPIANFIDQGGVPSVFGGRLFKQPDGSLVPEYYPDWRIRFRVAPGEQPEIVVTEYGVVRDRGRRRG